MRALLVVVLGIVLAGGGILAYAESRPTTLPEGLAIGDVAVGGLSPAAAEARLEAADGPSVDDLRVGGRTYRLDPARLGVRDDRRRLLAGAVDDARRTHAVRRLLAPERGESHRVTVSVDARRVSRLVARAAREARETPRDAELRLERRGPTMVPARAGRRLRAEGLRAAVRRSLVDPREQTVEAKLERVDPTVRTRADLARRYPSSLVVDRSARRARLFRGLRLVRTYDIAIGSAGNESPSGRYSITDKQTNPVWNVPDSAWAGSLAGRTIPPGPQNPLKARWMGIVDGVGFHGTADRGSIGSAASHGCFRMRVEDVIDLYDRVDVGTPVLIV